MSFNIRINITNNENEEVIVMKTINNIAPISSSNFLSRLPEREVSIFANEGMMLYTPASTYFYPLVLWKEGENIMVTPQSDLPKDQVAAIFGDEDVVPVAAYSFSEKELQKHFGENPELLADLLAFHDAHEDIDIQTILAILTYLEDEDRSVVSIMVDLDALSDIELHRLVRKFDEERYSFLTYFTGLLNPMSSTDDED